MSAVPPPVHPQRAWRNDLLDLLASMRFAISLLTVICIASAIGTVLKQGEPLVNYVDQFGPFWAEVFGALGLYRVYGTPWFLLILAFLVVSISLCVARNTPRILADWRKHKEDIRASSLKAFHHHAEGRLAQPLAVVQARVQQVLGQQGWSIRQQVRSGQGQGAAAEAGVMIAARLGAANKLGYIAAHSAVVLICLGGLVDGDLVVKVQAWAQHLQPFQGGGEPARARLSADNPAYRAQLFVPEGQRSAAAVVSVAQGMLVQPLPFEVELKRFSVDYYATGMPKRFASDIVIHDPRTGASKPFTVEVNHPVVYDGVSIFQSSFEDGGSIVRLRPLMLGAGGPASPVISASVNGDAVKLPAAWWAAQGAPQGWGDMNLEVTGLRVINVEDMAPTPGGKKFLNVGPSVSYKLRDAAGQAREYQNYMAPVLLDGQSVFLLGERDTPMEGFRYLRVPADENLSLQGWVRLRQALAHAAMRQEAARRFGQMAAPAGRQDLQAQLALSAQRALDLFAGAMPVKTKTAAADSAVGPQSGGLQALSAFIEQAVPPAERERMSATLVRILNGALFELLNLSREEAKLPPLQAQDEAVRAFMTQSVLSLSDAVFYPVPVVFALDGFEQKQASIFQVTRTPGRNVVYLGCALLVVGVFAMLYIRERRLWVWLQAEPGGGTALRLALSSTRRTLDTDREFDALRLTLLGESAPTPDTEDVLP